MTASAVLRIAAELVRMDPDPTKAMRAAQAMAVGAEGHLLVLLLAWDRMAEATALLALTGVVGMQTQPAGRMRTG